MRIMFKAGDIVDEPVEGLVCTGNVLLNMSGGVNGELLLRGGDNMQQELHEYLRKSNRRFVEPGFAMEIGPSPTHFKCIVYTVAVDGFYDSSRLLVEKALGNALTMLANKHCATVAVPALATGYGHLKLADFVAAFKDCMLRPWPFAEVRVVLRHDHDVVEALEEYGKSD